MIGCQSQLAGLVTAIIILIILTCLNSVIKVIPICLISAIVAFSALNNVANIYKTYFWFKYFKKDFMMFVISFLLSLAFPLADALILSAFISFLWILKRNSKPNWYLSNLMESDAKV